MRPVIMVLLTVTMIVSMEHLCAQSPPAKTPPTAAKLYTDEEIRKLAKYDIDKESAGKRGILDMPYLDVVPAGESYSRAKVFKKLNIEDARIRDFRHSEEEHVVFLTWQVSPSYDICCMSGTKDRANVELTLTDPERRVYGIRLLKRTK